MPKIVTAAVTWAAAARRMPGQALPLTGPAGPAETSDRLLSVWMPASAEGAYSAERVTEWPLQQPQLPGRPTPMTSRPAPPGVDTTKPSQARTYDYVLGGTNNYEVDRQLAATLTTAVPELVDTVWANRGFHQRAARYIAQQGVSQFIDIGAGLPTVGNTHEVVQEVNPDGRVVYTDIDPAVLAHAGEMLTGDSRTVMIEGDVRRPDEILGQPDLQRLIDFTQPVGLLITAVLHAVSDDPGPARLIARYMDAFPSGSYLALSHMTTEQVPPLRMQALIERGIQDIGGRYPRTRAQVREIFAGLEMVLPYPDAQETVTWLGLWGCENPETADSDGSRWACCAVGRKP